MTTKQKYEKLIVENRLLRNRLKQLSAAEAASDSNTNSMIINEQRLNTAQRVARIGSWERDLITGTITWSDQEFRLLGLKPNEIEPSYDAFLSFIHPDDKESVELSAIKAVQEHTPYDIEFRIIRKDGTQRMLRSRAEVIYDKDGTAVLMIGTGQDVTERRRAEKALRESEEQYKTLILNLRAAVYRCLNNKDWTVIYMSDFIEELSGYPASDFINEVRSYSSIIHPQDLEYVHNTVQEAVKSKEPYVIEYRIDHKNGSLRYVYEKGLGVFNSNAELKWLDGAIYDITEQKTAEDALDDYREHLEDLIETRTWALQLEIATRIEAEKRLTQSKKLLDSLGLAQSEFIADANPVKIFKKLLGSILNLTESEHGFIARILYDSKNNPYLENFTTTSTASNETTEELNKKQTGDKYEFEKIDTLFGAVVQSGKAVIVNASKNDTSRTETDKEHTPLNSFLGIPFYNGDRLVGMAGLAKRKNSYDQIVIGSLYSFTKTCANIIEGYNNNLKQKESEQALKESEHRYRHLFEHMNDSAFLAEVDTGIIVGTNRAAEVLLGRSRDEIIGMHQSELHPAAQREQFKTTFDTHATQNTSVAYECEVIKKDNSTALVNISSSTFNIGKNRFILSLFHDITERKQMEKEIQKGQKLESLGLLAGGIAHDFNNLLTAIMGNVSFSLHFLDKSNRLYKRLLEAEKATLRARDLTKQLITFAKGGNPVIETIDVEQIITESTSFALTGSNVKYTIDIEPHTCAIKADSGQINQVLNNLIINADQSMPEGGTIYIKTENVDIVAGSKECSAHLKKGEYVKVSITDQGTGIPKKHLHKIFDPYFTTKQSGSGLGLASAYSIVEKHNGYICVESEVGVGSTFTIYLPSSPDKESVSNDYIRTNAVKSAGWRVLIMDDEQIILDLVQEYLTHLGYTVVLATKGEEAIEAFKEAYNAGNPFDIVVMDLTIPGGMGGKETITKLLKLTPDIKAIVSSGYAQDPIMAEFKQYGFSGVVAKPYRLEELSAVIESLAQPRN